VAEEHLKLMMEGEQRKGKGLGTRDKLQRYATVTYFI
jgi:hypothetical protein